MPEPPMPEPPAKPDGPGRPAVSGTGPGRPQGEDDTARSKLVIVGIVAVVALFAVSVGLSVRDEDGRFGVPAGSRLGVVEDVLAPRTLSVADIARAGSSCLDGTSLVLAPHGSGCEIIVPPGVRRIALRTGPAGPSMSLTVSRTSDVTQTVDTAKAGPDAHHPDHVRFAVPYDGATLTLSDCVGPSSCRVDVVGRW